MSNPMEDFFADLDRACEAAERGNYRDAEKWTGLAERKLAMARRMCDLAIKAGWKPEYMEHLVKRGGEDEKDDAGGDGTEDLGP